METTIQVKSATLSANREWYNIKTEDNRELSVAVNKNPRLKEVIEGAENTPYYLTGETTEKNGKMYLWDSREKPVYRYTRPHLEPRDEGLIVAQSCLKSMCELYAGQADTVDDVLAEADKAYKWVMSKSTK